MSLYVSVNTSKQDRAEPMRARQDKKPGRTLYGGFMLLAGVISAMPAAHAQEADSGFVLRGVPTTSADPSASASDTDTGGIAPTLPATAASDTTTAATSSSAALAASTTTERSDATAADLDRLRMGKVTDDALDASRINLRQSPIDERRSLKKTEDDGTGIKLGTMILRPEVSQGVTVKSETDGSSKDKTTYWDTGLKGTLTSDWARHQLKITGQGDFRQKIAGDGSNDPSGRVDAELRLDLADDMAAKLTAGYGYSRESNTDPNAIRNAQVQSGVNQFSTGAVLEKDVGRLRGSVGLGLERYVYSDAKLADGSLLSNSDRNRNTVTLTTRLGYELSPALIPFIEASVGKTRYDQTLDSSGYARSGNLYGLKAGITSNFDEKLSGEIALGYKRATFDDSRLDALGAFALDSTVNWSPHRGTDVSLGFNTSIEPSTTAGVSGDVAYALTAAVAHQLRDNLIARLTGGTTWRDYRSASQPNTVYYTAGGGLTYSLNRYLDLNTDLTWEYTDNKTSPGDRTLTASVGVTVKR
ncbi:outer membrane beta-barrel protein [Allorhizobium sp. BGMRC 0089]|uniref:outer membrane beta-barrel protein n=1 Tax=Allorhizobium sonneratiae TaxID=2934936 RepID=UPI002033C282|nr:outer membrane beta-barrel protein [Allorhizobium sonneratiae]MCM2290853.1 outer membrane beta-barrel protein [Allorhizobium sonneratiae]